MRPAPSSCHHRSGRPTFFSAVFNTLSPAVKESWLHSLRTAKLGLGEPQGCRGRMLGLIRVQWVRDRRTRFRTWGAHGPSQLPLPRLVHEGQEVPALPPSASHPLLQVLHTPPCHYPPLLLRIPRVVSWVWSLVYGWEAVQACLGCPCLWLWLWLLPGTWGPSQLKLMPCSPQHIDTAHLSPLQKRTTTWAGSAWRMMETR